MAELPWNADAIATRQGQDGLRDVVTEGSLRDVVQRISALSMIPDGLRISLPDVRQAPTSWRDQELASLIRLYKLTFG